MGERLVDIKGDYVLRAAACGPDLQSDGGPIPWAANGRANSRADQAATAATPPTRRSALLPQKTVVHVSYVCAANCQEAAIRTRDRGVKSELESRSLFTQVSDSQTSWRK